MAKVLHTVGKAYQSPVERHYNTYKTSSFTLFLAGIPVTGVFTLKGSITSCRGQVSQHAIVQIGYVDIYINVCHYVSRYPVYWVSDKDEGIWAIFTCITCSARFISLRLSAFYGREQLHLLALSPQCHHRLFLNEWAAFYDFQLKPAGLLS